MWCMSIFKLLDSTKRVRMWKWFRINIKSTLVSSCLSDFFSVWPFSEQLTLISVSSVFEPCLNLWQSSWTSHFMSCVKEVWAFVCRIYTQQLVSISSVRLKGWIVSVIGLQKALIVLLCWCHCRQCWQGIATIVWTVQTLAPHAEGPLCHLRPDTESLSGV